MKQFHLKEPVRAKGNPKTASNAIIMLHGRGASGHDILSLAQMFKKQDTYFLAPEATGSQWYPAPFTQPLEHNQPQLDFSLQRIDQLLKHTQDHFPLENIYLLGFSQGACLCLEYAARNPQKYGGIIALSGGLIGEDSDLEKHSGDLLKTKVYLGCSQRDPYIGLDRVIKSINIFTQINASVIENVYPEPGHSVTPRDIGLLHNFIS